MEEFIGYKREAKNQRPELTASNRIVTIDGVDGAGKSTITKLVYEKVSKMLGENVVLATTSNLTGSARQENLKVLLDNNPTHQIENRIYAAGINRAYRDIIIPAVESDKLVIADRSEMDVLRYAEESGDETLLKERLQYIKDGTLTHKYWPGVRILIDVSPEDAWNNLQGREQKSSNDPKSLSEAQERAAAQEKASKTILGLEHKGEVKIFRVQNLRQSTEDSARVYLEKVADRIIDFLLENNILKK